MVKGNIANLLQQAQKMQQDMQKAQESLAQLEVTGQAGGGMVEVRMNGKHAVLGVKIDPAVADDVEMLEDLVTAAANDAVNRVQAATQEQMAGMTQGLNLPPGFKLPF
ncbi:MAG: YbaB/EbfC family nucleoid-associated protein [Pseudomonadota bacterium]